MDKAPAQRDDALADMISTPRLPQYLQRNEKPNGSQLIIIPQNDAYAAKMVEKRLPSAPGHQSACSMFGYGLWGMTY